MPTKKMIRQPDMPHRKSAWPGWIWVLSSEPMMLPQAESAWSEPRATARNAGGHALGHQRGGRPEHAADAQPDQEAVDQELGAGAGETRQSP